MKKILILNRSINQGGIDDVGVELAKFLADKCEVHMCLFFNQYGYKLPGVQIHSLDIPPATNTLGKVRNLFRRILSFRRIRKEVKPSIVIAQGNLPDFIVAFDSKFGGNYTTILTVHNILSQDLVRLKGRLEKLIFHLIANWPDRWVAVSEAVKDDFEKSFGAKRVHFITNPVRYLDPEETKVEGRFIFSAGRLAPQKDFITLIKAFSLVAEKVSDLNLVIAGEGQERRNLERLIEDLGLSKRVKLTGHVKNIYPYLNGAEMFVSSSIYEGTPMTILQALSLGKPVVATKVVGTMYAVGNAGLFSPIGDYESLAENILKLAEDRGLQTELSVKSKRQSEKFSMEVIGKEWEALINSL